MAKLQLAMLCLLGLTLPAFAQASSSAAAGSDASAPAGPPVSSADAFRMFADACTEVSSGAEGAYDRVNNSGWVPNAADNGGPYNAVYSGSREIGSFGEVDIWGSVQTFPTQRLGYCRIDFGDGDAQLDFTALNGIKGLSGNVQDEGDGNVYGSWETADKKLLVIGDRTDGAVELEFNLLLGDTPGQ